MNIAAGTFEECLSAFEPAVRKHRAVNDPDAFMRQVRLREAVVSTATSEQIAFPHARTTAVSQLFLAIGRSETGISFRPELPAVHLIFLLGAPSDGIADYLGCVAWLARRVRDPKTRTTLMLADTPEALLQTLASGS
jgi:mannitol/fructose-specific phosphotransferase system IIA component (Ntr-type)